MSAGSSSKPTANPADKRRNLRSPLIALSVKLDDGRKSFFGYVTNISRSGMFVPSTNPRDPGSQIQVELQLPEPISRPVRCACEVVWQRQFRRKMDYEPGMGLRFLDLDEEVAEEIDKWVGQELG